MSRVRTAVVVLSTVVLGAAGLGHALDREGRLVAMGASPWDVQAIWGDPEQVSDTIGVVLKRVYAPQGRVAGHLPVVVSKQVWIYHFGPSRLLYILNFLEEAPVKNDAGE